MLVQATSPLTTPKDFNKGIKLYKDYDSILSVVKQKRFIWDNKGRPINYNYKKRPRRQDWEGYLVENGAFYITTKNNLLKNKLRYFKNIGIVEMPQEKSFQVDTYDDLSLINKLI